MKLARPATLLTVGLMALSLGGVGCNKNPQKTTHIPGYGPGAGITDDGSTPPIGKVTPPPIDIGPGPVPGPGVGTGPGPVPVPVPNTSVVTSIPPNSDGLVASDKDRSHWQQNRTEFADQTVYFEFDKFNIKPSEVSKLEEVVRRMKTMPNKALKVEGHCDERGTEEYNRSLGDRRAQSIREWLATHGLKADLIDTITFGEDKPLDPGHTEAAWKKNRRGELVLLSPN